MKSKRQGSRGARPDMGMLSLETGTGCQPVNRTLYVGKDNYDILCGIDTGSFDLVAMDPPFNKGAPFVGKVKDKHVGSMINKRRQGREKSWEPDVNEQPVVKFSDVWAWDNTQHEAWLNRLGADEDLQPLKNVIKIAYTGHSPAMGAYISFMTARCLELRRILRPTGAIFLQCDPTASNYLRAMMDAVFGCENFRGQIIWQRAAGRAKGSQHKSKKLGTDCDYIFCYAMSPRTTVNDLDSELCNDGSNMSNLWSDIPNETSRLSTGWPTQKPVKLYERLIKLVAQPNMKILDPFCGSATTCVAAERITRDRINDLTIEWVGIEQEPDADVVLSERMRSDVTLTGYSDYMLNDTKTSVREFLTIFDYGMQGVKAIPRRTDLEMAIPHSAKRKIREDQGEFFWWMHRQDRKTELLNLQWKNEPVLHPDDHTTPHVCKCENENCLRYFTNEDEVECDHVVPVAYYRSHHPHPTPALVHHVDNLRLICSECRRKKGARMLVKELCGSQV